MDIYILRDGQETGPHSEETARTLLRQGGVTASDFAWRDGMPKWLPLNEVLAAEPGKIPTAESPSRQPAKKSDPATPKQKALLSFLGIALPADLSRDQAAMRVNDAMEDPSNTERLTQWNHERLRLHPELFAAEIQAKKENRAQHFFELCQTTGTEYFSGITKAHCQVLVGFLDVKFPHWDSREAEAAKHYFFPAVAEKFPQLVQKQWRGRLHYVEGQKVAAEIVRKSHTSKLRPSATSPFVAVTRGVVLGVLILGVLYLGYRTSRSTATGTPPAAPAPEPAAQLISEPPPANPAPVVTAAVPPLSLPPIEPVQPVAQVAQVAPPPPAPAPIPEPAPAVVHEPGMTPAPMAANPTPPMAPEDPAMAPIALNSTAVATAPMASLPGTEPPVPVAPPPATMPAPAILPLAIPEPPPTPAPVVPEPAPAFPVAKTNLLLTKPVEIQLIYGKIVLPPGTPVKLVSRQGGALKVSYQNSVLTVPSTSTDLE